MPHRSVPDDVIRDSVSSLRMADDILREMAEAGALDTDAEVLPSLLAVAYDEIIGMTDEIGSASRDRRTGRCCEARVPRAQEDGLGEVLRTSEERLESLARMIEGAIRSPARSADPTH
jgi:hypothetical protein